MPTKLARLIPALPSGTDTSLGQFYKAKKLSVGGSSGMNEITVSSRRNHDLSNQALCAPTIKLAVVVQCWPEHVNKKQMPSAVLSLTVFTLV